MARLSVIIPGFNTSPEWWERCVKSVLAAIGENDEVICIDDGSRKIAMPTFSDPRVREIRLEENVGQAFARNKALGIAQGEWVSFVDSDDEILPNIYQDVFKRLEDGAFDIALFGVRVMWSADNLYKDDIPRDENPGLLTPSHVNYLIWENLFEYPVNKIYRRSFLERNEICFDLGICPGEDTIFNFKCLLARARWCFVPSVGYVYYRMDNTSLSRYLPNYRASLKLRSDIARKYKESEPDGVSVLQKVFERTERDLDALEWNNAWRQCSKVSISSRWRMRPGLPFVRKVFESLARRFLYFGFIRKYKIRKMYPNVKEIPSATGRKKWVDIAKGLAILLVCAGHTRLGERGALASWITSFHMPFFFMIAGYCFEKSRYKSFAAYARRKCLVLGYPYFMLTMAAALMLTLLNWNYDTNWFRVLFCTTIPGAMMTGFWFVRALFWVELFFGLMIFANIANWFRLFVIILGAVIGFHWAGNIRYFEGTNFFVALLFYQIGYLMSCVNPRSLSIKTVWKSLPIFVALHILLIFMLGWPVTVFFGTLTSWAYLATAILGSGSLVAVSILVEYYFSGRFFAWLGRYSILLLAIHPTMGLCRPTWVARFPILAGVPSQLMELILIVGLMWLLAGPLNFFMRMPKVNGRRECK